MAYFLDLDYRVKPDNDIKRKVKPEYDSKEGCFNLDYRVKPDNDGWGGDRGHKKKAR